MKRLISSIEKSRRPAESLDTSGYAPLYNKRAAKVCQGRKTKLYVDDIESHGQALLDKVCELDLEGILAKRKH